jgi:hypothetical protein
MFRNYAIATIALTAAFAAPAAAGVLTMTAENTEGTDAWAAYTGYKMVLTITSDDLNTAGSASSFTLQSWNFRAYDRLGVEVLEATGGPASFSAGPGTTTFLATISLNGTIDPNGFEPKADYVAFSYEFTLGQTLDEAIESSAGKPLVGELILGTSDGGAGELVGTYLVPAPSALALIGVGGLIGRRRRN